MFFRKLILTCVVLCFFYYFQGLAAGLDDKIDIPVNGPGFQCLPNSQFMDDCNTCTCDDSGVLARCTAMACDPSERTKRYAQRNGPGAGCILGTTYKDDCNTCWCQGDGRGPCTKMSCVNTKNNNNDDGDQTNRVARQTHSSTQCVPGTTFMKDCNRCLCGENGIVACTLKGCLKNTILPTVPRNSSLHLNNHTHSHGNSTHRWTRQTKQTPVPTEYIYTQAELDSPNFTCTPSQSFKMQCNTCWCAADGKRARFCTKFPCTKPK